MSLSNLEIARQLDEVAELLEAGRANPYRVRAYRRAADTLRTMEAPVDELLAEGGTSALTELPGIGESLARSIEHLARTGRFGLLRSLKGASEPEDALETVPGIGPELARRIHHDLGIEHLRDLEDAAWDGRLARVPGIGRGRVKAVRETLAGRLRRPDRRRARVAPPADEPPASEILDVDREYRELAKRGKLPCVAPRRFNPTREAWLPILHARRGDARYTALYSNSARAHEMGATHDWVVVYRDDPGARGQWTVVTAGRGVLAGRRVVVGREAECRSHHRLLEGAAAPAAEETSGS